MKKWANVMMPDGKYDSNVAEGTLIQENELGSIFVWIPRYEYKINYTDENNFSQGGTISVNLIDTATTTATDGYTIHPAFRDGTHSNFLNGEWDNEIAGFWTAKFEASKEVYSSTNRAWISQGITNDSNGNIIADNTTSRIVSKPNRSAWSRNSINNAYNGSLQAKCNEDNSNRYSTDIGIKASTTGNIYGLYDMNGGLNEYTSAYFSGNANPISSNNKYSKGERNMRRISRILFNGLFILMIILPIFEEFGIYLPDLIGEVQLNPLDYARITDVDYSATVNDEIGSGGSITVKEKLTFDIHAASKNNLFWELWRDLPESYDDGVKVTYRVKSVKQILENGKEIEYKESSKLYWNDSDYTSKYYGPNHWYHSPGPYNEELSNYECVFFYVDGMYREKPVFEIEYEMYNASMKYKDCSELYLSMYSEETIKHLNSFKGEILIPNQDMPQIGNYTANTYGTNKNEFPFTESDTKNPGYHTFAFDLDKSDLKFRPYNQYIEFDLVAYGEDKHKFTNYANRNRWTNTNVLDELNSEQIKYEMQPLASKINKITVFVISVMVSVLIMYILSIITKREKKKHIFYNSSMNMQYFREIPGDLDPYFAATFACCKNKKTDLEKYCYSAIMLSLVRKKYIELQKIDQSKQWIDSNIKLLITYIPSLDNIQNGLLLDNIEKPKNEFASLTENEQRYFNLIYKHSKGNEITIKQLQKQISDDFKSTMVFQKNIKKSIVNIGINNRYFQKADYSGPRKSLNRVGNINIFIAIIFLVVVNLISYQTRLDLAFGAFSILGASFLIAGMHYKIFARKLILLTQLGEDEYAKWNGLYNFLNSETLMKEKEVIEISLWEEYLVYATAFGIAEKVQKALKIRCPEIEIQSSPILNNHYYLSRDFSTRNAIRNSVRTASANSYYSSGGYGGGGRGGGRRRRRTLIHTIKIYYKNRRIRN